MQNEMTGPIKTGCRRHLKRLLLHIGKKTEKLGVNPVRYLPRMRSLWLYSEIHASYRSLSPVR